MYIGLIVITIFLGIGKNRKIVLYKDIADFGLTLVVMILSIIASFTVTSFVADKNVLFVIYTIIGLTMMVFIFQKTYHINNQSFLFTLMATFTKIPLSLLWLLNFFSILSPSGKTASDKRVSRTNATLTLAVISSILAALMLNP
jgi:hypothetical protein